MQHAEDGVCLCVSRNTLTMHYWPSGWIIIIHFCCPPLFMSRHGQ